MRPLPALTATVLIEMGLSLSCGGCAAKTTGAFGTDVPQVPGLEAAQASAIKESGGVMITGRCVYTGRIESVDELADETSQAFASAGWNQTLRSVDGGRADLRYSKGDRTADVRLLRNPIDPAMSRASVAVASAAAAAQ